MRDAFRARAADDFDDVQTPQTGKTDANGLGVGVVVEHASYGRGIITDLSGFGTLRRTKIRFARHGEKTFVVDKVKLTVIIDE